MSPPLTQAMAACNHADLGDDGHPASGDPTELALLRLAADHGEDVSLATRERWRRQLFRFDPRLKVMTTVDGQDSGLVVHTKGAPEEVLARGTMIRRGQRDIPLTAMDREAISRAMTGFAGRGLRVLAVASRQLPAGSAVPEQSRPAARSTTTSANSSATSSPTPFPRCCRSWSSPWRVGLSRFR